MHTRETRINPFGQVFDVVVVGSGYAGFAAAMTLSRAGRSVLLIGPTADLVWESGRAFGTNAGKSGNAIWNQLCSAAGDKGGYDGAYLNGTYLDGAIAEVVASDMLFNSSAGVLYYSTPVAVEMEGSEVEALIVATKAGLKKVAGRQWIDATERGDLIRLATPGVKGREATSATMKLFLQHQNWETVAGAEGLDKTVWRTERMVSQEVSLNDPAWREKSLEALVRVEGLIGAEIGNVSMSHFSFEPLPKYEAEGRAKFGEMGNVVSASAAFGEGTMATLAERFELGIKAAAGLDKASVHEVDASVLKRLIGVVKPVATRKADVLVAGAGTGGALAALAAAKAGAQVICVEPMNFAGGIGVGGGIHFYYHGVPGGLQQDVDRRTRDLMAKFGGGPLGDGPFNPWAKMLTMQQLLREAGVDLITRALLFGVETRDGRVVAALVATAEGVLRIEAEAFVDGTGDGDLAAMAGAKFTLGREGDGVPHAYSQSSGALRQLNGRPRMNVVNYDAGYTDATDPEDLSRARLTGIRQYLRSKYGCVGGDKEGERHLDARPTYIAPAIGLRQARQIVTQTILTLDDQIRGRCFPDPIGYTGAHYDNHATDYEFESDESLFWVWVNRSWWTRYAGQLSYGMLVPRGVKNVWIASRCVGVSQDAHHSTRMQRDIQRIGEAAGFAAAEAARQGADGASLPYASLRHWLDQTGALLKKGTFNVESFGATTQGSEVQEGESQDAIRKALSALDGGRPGADIWRLYKSRETVEQEVVQRLNSERPMTSWLAACVMAMWNLPESEGRLIEAIRSREYGFEEAFKGVDEEGKPLPDFMEHPFNSLRIAPHWLTAVALLRRVGTGASLEALEQLVSGLNEQAVDLTATVAISLERMAERLNTKERTRAAAILEKLAGLALLPTIDHPWRAAGRITHEAATNTATEASKLPAFGESFSGNVLEDSVWQMHLAVGRARMALGLEVQEEARKFVNDPRLLVRRAFERAGIGAVKARAKQATVVVGQ